jgi:hypothetical protein
MIVENFINELLNNCSGVPVTNIYEVKLEKPDRGYKLVIEFENGFKIIVDGYVSMDFKNRNK